MKSKVLLVEDSREYQLVVTRALSGHQVTCVTTVDEAFEVLGRQEIDIILLDLGLPKKPGFSLLSDIQARPEAGSIPILCLTGKTEIADKVTAFSLGADDYILKPFDPIELRARVESRVQKKRNQQESSSNLVIGDLEINQSSHRVSIVGATSPNKTEIVLTQTEFKLLCCLAKKPDRVFTRDQLLVVAWGEDASVLDRVVDVHLCGLRKKMGSYGRYIKSVPGVGYKLVIEEEEKTNTNKINKKKAA